MPAALAQIRPSALLRDSEREPGISRLSCGADVASCAGLAYGERHTEVVMTKKIVSCLFALVLLLACAFPAAALEIHIDNSQALGGSLALRTDGVWVTKGWVNFGPHSKQTVTLETWEPVFYLHVEVGGGASVELPGEKHRFWVVRDVFELEGDARPARGQQADFIKVEVRGDDPRFTLRF